MNEGLIPSRYAKALYKYAQEHHVAAPIYEEMKRLDAAFATHTELSKALSNPALMKKQTDKTLEFVYEIDPSIIGGFILRVDSMQLDASVNSELKKLRLKLLNSK